MQCLTCSESMSLTEIYTCKYDLYISIVYRDLRETSIRFALQIYNHNLFNKSVNPHLEAALGLKSWLPFLRILQPDTHRNMEQMDL